MHFLCHMVGNGKLVVPEHRVTALRNFCRPERKKKLRSLHGGVVNSKEKMTIWE